MAPSRVVGWALFCVLSVIAIIHTYWAFGGVWPAQSVKALIHTVIGDPRFFAMPPTWMTLCVSIALMAAGWIALERAEIVRFLPRWMVTLGAWVLLIVFILRGLSSFLVAFGIRHVTSSLTEPFATYDVWLYGPLCVLIALGYLTLTFKKMRR